jgi:hypothetical protein
MLSVRQFGLMNERRFTESYSQRLEFYISTLYAVV